MKIVFTAGATSTKVGDKKPTKFYGGETEDIVDKEARYLLAHGFAAKPNSKEAKAFLATLDPNPRTRRIDLDATTPGLAKKIRAKSRLKELAADLNDEDDGDEHRDDEGGARGRGRGGDKDKDKKEGGAKEGDE